MKLTRILTITVALLAIGLPSSSLAKKPKGEAKAGKGDPAKKAARQASAAALNLYDKDSNGTISGDETAAVRTAFAADKTGPLKGLDVSGDGTLDDNEIAAIKKGKAHGKGKKKNQPAPAPTN